MFCIVLLWFLYRFVYVHLSLFCLYKCKDYCHRVTTQLQLIIIIIIIIIIDPTHNYTTTLQNKIFLSFRARRWAARVAHHNVRRRQTSDVQILVTEEEVSHGQQFTATTVKRKVFTGRWIHFTSHFGSKTEKKKKNLQKTRNNLNLPNSKPRRISQLAVPKSRTAVNM